ncbi:MAG: protoheme IX farnesyltransferase [Omnitrophica WOR_2 bacterium]
MISRFILLLKSIYNISKGGISLSVALTTATGYFLATRQIDLSVVFPFTGVLLLAQAASIINQIKERHTDKLMPRTQNRPLISNELSIRTSFLFSIFLTISGLFILGYFNGVVCALLGLFNLLWYDYVYTPLKYKTAFASIPGGIVGAVPPIIGWIAGGGNILHPTSIALAVFFFIGQIPHFWLIVIKYSNEYELAGIKSITERFSLPQIKRLVFTWILATSLCGSIFSLFIIINNNFTFWLLQSYSLALVVFFLFWFTKELNYKSTRAFISINIYYLIVMITIIADIAIGRS